MKIALLADAHGNLPALEAVLADADAGGCEAVWYLGDFVGYGPFPEETVQVLQETCDACILGNYDRKVLTFPALRAKWRRTKEPAKYAAFEFASERLSDRSRNFLGELPEKRRLEAAGLRVLLVHGSPASDSEHLDEATPLERLRELAEKSDVDLVCCGHSHVQFDRAVDGVRFINPGAVGRPEGGDPRACYAVLCIEHGACTMEPLRVAYDVERTISAVQAHDLPPAFAEMFRRGRSLDDLAAEPSPPPTAPSSPPVEEVEDQVRRLAEHAERLAGAREHFEQVTRLALQLFDELREVHGLGERDRGLLEAAGLLHDIGWVEGGKGHHKTAARLILNTPELPLRDEDRPLVACIARYHRKALPKEKHSMYQALSADDRRRVEILAGLLRIGDGLDRTHRTLVRQVRCSSDRNGIRILAQADLDADAEQFYAQRKSDLLERALRRAVCIECVADLPQETGTEA
jgi:putative phosphoesterase